MTFAADCLAATGLDSTQLGIGFAVALGVVAIGLAIFARSWRNRAVLALAPLLILAGIGGLALTSSSPAQAETSCGTAAATPTPTVAPTGAAPRLQIITYGNYNGMTPYVPDSTVYPQKDLPANAGTIFLPACFWQAGSTVPSFMQQLTAVGDGAITYSATFDNALLDGSMTSTGLVTLSPTALGTKASNYSTWFKVTATSEYGSTFLIYTALSNCVETG